MQTWVYNVRFIELPFNVTWIVRTVFDLSQWTDFQFLSEYPNETC